MFLIIYQHSKHFNLETLLMLKIFSGIFGKIPPSWKLFSSIYQFNWWVDLIGNFHYYIFKLKIYSCNIVVNHVQLKRFWLKKRGFLLVQAFLWAVATITSKRGTYASSTPMGISIIGSENGKSNCHYLGKLTSNCTNQAHSQ
jgi:hypothetical protein